MMQPRKLFIGLLLILAVPSAAATAQQTAKPDTVVVQVNEDNPKTMNLALNNVQNLISFYKEKGETVRIEVVAFGPGLQMLREDTSPVKDRIAAISVSNPDVQFSACGNTLAGVAKQEGNKPPLVSEAKLVPAGVARIVELQKQGYIYIRP